MVQKTVTISKNQSLYDIALQELGSVLAIMDIALANDISPTQILVPGQRIVIPDSEYKNSDIVNYYTVNGIKPATAITEIEAQDTTGLDYLYPQTLPIL